MTRLVAASGERTARTPLGVPGFRSIDAAPTESPAVTGRLSRGRSTTPIRCLARWRPSGGRAELTYFVLAYLVYWAARWIFAGDAGTAQANAMAVWNFEKATGTAVELSVQGALNSGAMGWILSNLYLAAQMAVLPAAIVWLYRRSKPIYRKLRTTVIATWMLSVPVIAIFPVAPPRLADLGFVDTVSDQAAVALTGSSTAFYNAFAAVPSLHVGFAFAIGVAAYAAVHRPWAKLLAASWGPIVTLTVVATGNHYVFDAVAGLAMTAAGFAIWRLNSRREDLLARIIRPRRPMLRATVLPVVPKAAS